MNPIAWWQHLSWQAASIIVLVPAGIACLYFGTRKRRLPETECYRHPVCSPRVSRAWVRAMRERS